MKVYSLFDTQFGIYSDPFLSADDLSAERLIIQTAEVSEGLRARLHVMSLYYLADFNPSASDVSPLSAGDSAELVSSPERLGKLLEQSVRMNKEVSNG